MKKLHMVLYTILIFSILSASVYSVYADEAETTVLTENEAELLEYVADEISEKIPEEIEIPERFSITEERFGEIVQSLSNLIQYEYPEIFYITDGNKPMSLGHHYEENDNGESVVTSITPKYIMTKTEIRNKQAEINREIQKITSSMTADMTDVEKVLIAHDYIVSNYEYDTSRQNQNRTIDKMVTDKKGVCQAYSYLFKSVMDYIGIDCVTVPSAECNHMWNKVEIDDEWYNIDLTYDDPLYNMSTNISHKYFLVNDDEIKTLDPHEHAAWNTLKWDGSTECEKAESSRFSSLPIREISGATVSYNGTFLCFDDHNRICSVDFENNRLNVLYSGIDDAEWYVYGTDNSVYTSPYSAIVKFGGKIYFNSPDKVYLYDMDANSAEVIYEYTNDEDISNTYLFGLYVKNNTLYAEYTTDLQTGIERSIEILSNRLPCSSEITQNAETGERV